MLQLRQLQQRLKVVGKLSILPCCYVQQQYQYQWLTTIINIKSITSSSSSSSIIDLRSDTVTSPSIPMLQSTLSATTGDDVMGEDPTVNKLQETVATIFEKEAGLFVPSGTMSNLISLLAHCFYKGRQSSEIIIGMNSHISLWEGGNVTNMGGIHTRQIQEDYITAQMNIQDIHDVILRYDGDDDHCTKAEVICLENTHNMMGGVALSMDYINNIGNLSEQYNIKLHMDGARIFHAAIAAQLSVKDLCSSADSVSVCLSKGLGAPIGSVLVGETEFIRLAKRVRKRAGGGMRQAGVIAAMGLYAIENNIERLIEDHTKAQRLSILLAQEEGLQISRNGQVDTNIFYFTLPSHWKISKENFIKRLNDEWGVKISGGYARGGDSFRIVTHMDVSEEDIDRAADAILSFRHDV